MLLRYPGARPGIASRAHASSSGQPQQFVRAYALRAPRRGARRLYASEVNRDRRRAPRVVCTSFNHRLQGKDMAPKPFDFGEYPEALEEQELTPLSWREDPEKSLSDWKITIVAPDGPTAHFHIHMAMLAAQPSSSTGGICSSVLEPACARPTTARAGLSWRTLRQRRSRPTLTFATHGRTDGGDKLSDGAAAPRWLIALLQAARDRRGFHAV
eukprot:1160106-Prymnesium_polylepis.1